MIVKNSDCNLSYLSNLYSNKKIDNININQSNQGSTVSPEVNKSPNPSRVDTIELSPHRVQNHPTFPEIKNRIISELTEDKNVEYLANLKSQISSNKYATDPKQIAKILLLSSD